MRFWIRILGLVILVVNCSCQRSPSPVASNEPVKTSEAPSAGLSEDELFEKLVKSQVEVGGASLVRIVDRKSWPSAPVPDASVIVGIARHPAQEPAKSGGDYEDFSFVLLAAGDARAKNPSVLLLGLVVPDLPVDAGGQNRPLSVDVSPIKIQEDRYAFGVRHLVGGVGNKAGRQYEIMSLYTFHDAALKEIFRDVVRVSGGSCNVEMKIVQQPSQVEGFYDIAREFSRSSAECSLSRRLRAPNVQKWDSTLGEFADAKGRFLHVDDLFKGWPLS